jgi:hypothetical protein
MVKNRKKTRKNGLTGSRTSNRPASKAVVARLDALDGLRDCCDNLTALAGLLEACSHSSQGELLKREMVGRTGSLMLREVKRAEVLVDVLDKVQ